MKQSAEIKVHSSTPGIMYSISITQEGGSATVKCSCPAGDNGQLCKHVLASLQGDDSILIAGQKAAWNEWRAIFSKSELAVLFADFLDESDRLEKQINALQQKAKGIKKGFARVAIG